MPRSRPETSHVHGAAGTGRHVQDAPQSPAHRSAAGPGRETTPSHRDLGLALYRVRLEKGLSLRAMAQRMGYSSHSMFAELEKARRLPSEALLRTYEEHFDLPPRSLVDLRQQALIERAARLIPEHRAPAGVVAPAPAPDGWSPPEPARARTTVSTAPEPTTAEPAAPEPDAPEPDASSATGPAGAAGDVSPGGEPTAPDPTGGGAERSASTAPPAAPRSAGRFWRALRARLRPAGRAREGGVR
jgi:transcriptional regulator with XRE-family HTH domain